MIIQLDPSGTEQDRLNILSEISTLGYRTTKVATKNSQYLICIGVKEFDIRKIGNLKGVKDVHRVSDPNKLVSKQWKVRNTEISFDNGEKIGNNHLALIAGPCSIENEAQVIAIADFLQKNKIKLMRGGVFKPRSSPYAFRGKGLAALKYFNKVCRERGIKVVCEVMQVSQIAQMYDYVDVFQVGARNVQNYNLLDELGMIDKPVLLKRGMSTTLEEFLSSAEYIFSNGNEQIILCERGIRTFEKEYRNTLDLNAVPVLHEKTHLPVIVDPSHGIGIRNHVETMALSAVMAGADGIIVEIHPQPEKALSDGFQTLNFDEAGRLFEKLKKTYSFYKSVSSF